MSHDIDADDYITKSFELVIFLSRLNVLLRKSDNFIDIVAMGLVQAGKFTDGRVETMNRERNGKKEFRTEFIAMVFKQRTEPYANYNRGT